MRKKKALAQELTPLEVFLQRYVGSPIESDARDLAQLWALIQLLQPEAGREEAAYVWLCEQQGVEPNPIVAAHIRRVTTKEAA